MSEHQILILVLVIISFNFFLNLILDIINDRNRRTKLSEEEKEIYDEEKYKKSMQYAKDNGRMGYISSTISFVILIGVFFLGAFGKLNDLLADYIHQPILLALAFFGVIALISELISLPFQIYDTFVIEEKYGFNKTTPKLFVIDKLKSLVLMVVVGGGLLYLFLWLIFSIGDSFWYWFWLVMVLFSLFINTFYTNLILPIFNRLSPLQEGELRNAIEEYCKKVNFPLTNILLIDGSKRSNKANAFFSGWGKQKKIVLYDTLVENHSNEELVAVLAHEVGHYKKKHIVLSMILGVIQSGIMLYLLSLVIFEPKLSLAAGATAWAPQINLIIFSFLYSPLSMLLSIGMNILSRKNEYEADTYAADTYSAKALMDALKKLSVDNLSNLHPHRAYVFFHYSHPPLLKRLENLKS